MVIDRLNEEAIELTSAVGPAKDWFSNHSKKKIVRVIFAQGPRLSKKKNHKNHSVPPSRKHKDTPVLGATLRQGQAERKPPRVS